MTHTVEVLFMQLNNCVKLNSFFFIKLTSDCEETIIDLGWEVVVKRARNMQKLLLNQRDLVEELIKQNTVFTNDLLL